MIKDYTIASYATAMVAVNYIIKGIGYEEYVYLLLPVPVYILLPYLLI